MLWPWLFISDSKVLANEVTVMPTIVLGGAFFQYDSWQGYPREREELLTHIRDRRVRDVVFVTGDVHTFIAGDVRTQMGLGETVATELVGIGEELGLSVWAETFAQNSASQRVLEKAGLELVEETLVKGRLCRVFRKC